MKNDLAFPHNIWDKTIALTRYISMFSFGRGRGNFKSFAILVVNLLMKSESNVKQNTPLVHESIVKKMNEWHLFFFA
jgi:hypothetical protein